MQSGSAADNDDLPFIAYEVHPPTGMPVSPAPVNRGWMDETPSRFAYRCLPLAIANQAGWIVQNPASFCVRWNGGPHHTDTQIVFDQLPPDDRITSTFGSGVVTFNLPFLFRTPPGINLWVKGPTNWPIDGLAPLEGVVESDWTCATFTMNWKITRPNFLIRLERGQPICMLVPYPRNFLEKFQPVHVPLEGNREVHDAYLEWSKQRDEFRRQLAVRDEDAVRRGWQKDYFQGRDPGRERVEAHQTKLQLRPFRSGD